MNMFTKTEPGDFLVEQLPFRVVPLGAAAGGIGDVNSNARGAGARFNAGKPQLDLIPLRLIADSFADPARGPGAMLPPVLWALYAVGEFQETGDARALKDALRSMSGYWRSCARVFDYGRKKYAAWNWAKGMAWSVPIACIGRHALALLEGEGADPESGELHEGHILCNIVMLAVFVDTYPEGNDLPPAEFFRPAADRVDVAKALDSVSMDVPVHDDHFADTHVPLGADEAVEGIVAMAGIDVATNRIEVAVPGWRDGIVDTTRAPYAGRPII